MKIPCSDSHHKIVRIWAEKINEQYKGYDPISLSMELNNLEPEEYIKRQRNGNGHLRRHFSHIPDDISEYEVPSQLQSVSFNLLDCKTVFYKHEDDTLYLSMTRCNCDTCLLDSFLNCKKSVHHIHRFPMIGIKSDRIYPAPSKSNNLPLDSKDPSQKQADGRSQKAKRTKVQKTRNIKIESEETSTTTSPTATSSTATPPTATSSNTWKVIRQKMVVFEQSVGFKMIERPQTSKMITCNISDNEVKEVTKRWKSFAITFPYEEMPFKPQNEYDLGSVSYIIQRFKCGTDQSNGPAMNCPSNDIYSENSAELLNPTMFLKLTQIFLSQPSQTFTEWMNNVKQQLNGNYLPRSRFDKLIIGLFSTTGMKKRFSKGQFAYDSTPSPGHFITMDLNMQSSSLTIYDTLNTDIRSSEYFDFPLTLTIINYIYCYYKHERNESREALKVIQQKMQKQKSVDCGPHTLMNIELLIQNKNLASQAFNNQLIADVRKYHFLLYESSINDLRLDM